MKLFRKKQITLAVLVLSLIASLCFLTKTDAVYAADSNGFVINGNGVLTSYEGTGGDITIPASVKEIGKKAFAGNSNIASIKFAGKVSLIGTSAFDSCSSLQKIVLPEGLTTIEDNAFWGCKSLTNVNIPSTVTTIGPGTFCQCDSLMGEKGAAVHKYAEKYNIAFYTISDLKTKLADTWNKKKGKATVSWIMNPGCTSYEVQYATNKKFKSAKTVKASGTDGTKTISSLKKGKTYYVRIRGIRTVCGMNYISKWSSAKSIKIKK